MVYKLKPVGKDCNLTRFRPLDLYWIFPYWLHNTPNGRKFLSKFSPLGNLWKFEYIVEHILRNESNPFSNRDVLRLWEMKRFDDIRKHLELDLVHTFSFFKSSVVQEALNGLQKQHLNTNRCKDRCPYRQLLQQTPDKASCYCSLLQELTLDERDLSAIDAIDYPLPGWNVSWIPHCLE